MKTLAWYEDLGDRLLVVNANASKRNVLSTDFYTVLQEALALAATASRITAVIIRGDGNYFCAGGNLGLLAEHRTSERSDRVRKIDDLHDVIRAVMNCPKPVIAAVEGGAAGAGVSLAFACDFIVADDTSTFTIAYVKAGLVPDGGLTSTLSAHVPRALLMRMALLGEPVTAQRLHSLGAVSETTETGKAIEAAYRLADRLSAGASATQGTIKALINNANNATLAEQMDAERDAMADAIVSPEAVEGMSAFLDKRPPDFRQLRDQG